MCVFGTRSTKENNKQMNIQKFAQKAIVINSKNQILMIKYGQAKY